MEYQLTCAICTRLANRDMKVLKKESVVGINPFIRVSPYVYLESVLALPVGYQHLHEDAAKEV